MMAAPRNLTNGVIAVADLMPSLETVAIGVMVNAGSVDEGADEHGIAHMLEHMAFKGTKTRSARMIVEEIESVGGYINAATSHQRTGYYARILKNDLHLGVDILADILKNSTYDEAELDKEKNVIIQEIREASDIPDDKVFDLLQEATWGDHALARPILGTEQSVKTHSCQSIRGFLNKRYQPSQMVVAAAGNFDPETFFALANEKFGEIEEVTPAAKRTKPTFRGGVRYDERSLEQAHLALAFPGAGSSDPDFFATRIFADALGGGMSSRLFQKLREERGLAYNVYAFADGYDQGGLAGAYLSADASHLEAAATLIRGELEEMAAGVSEEEIERARAMLRSSLMMGLESPAVRIESASAQLFTFGRLFSPQELKDQLDAVTGSEVSACAEKALSGERAVALVGEGDIEKINNVFN